MDTQYSDNLIEKGVALRKSGNFLKAIEVFDKAKQFPQTLFRAHFETSNVYLAQGKFDSAIKELFRAVALEPASVPANTALGVAYRKKLNYEQAIHYLRKAINDDPGFIQAAQYLTRVLDDLKDYAQLYDVYIKLYPLHKQSAHFLFSYARFMIEDSPMREDPILNEEAISILNKSREMGLRISTMEFYVAQAYFNLKDYQACCFHLEKFFHERRQVEGGKYMVVFEIDKEDVSEVENLVQNLERLGDKVFIIEINRAKDQKRKLGRGPIIDLD